MLLEFALVMGVLWMLVAGTIELGRMVAAGHLIQGAARSVARSMALEPTGANTSFAMAIQNFFDPDYLVIDMAACRALDITPEQLARGDEAEEFDGLPLLNRLLFPLMIREDRDVDGEERSFLRYPGTLVRHLSAPPAKPCATAYTVAVPELRSEGGSTRVCWHRVVEELVSGGTDGTRFALSCAGEPCGMAGVQVRFPFQSAAFPAWRETGEILPDGRPQQRVAAWNEGAPGEPISASGGSEGCSDLSGKFDNTARVGILGIEDGRVDAYGGPLGLGALRVLPEIASGPSRAYRKVLAGSALYPREGFL